MAASLWLTAAQAVSEGYAFISPKRRRSLKKIWASAGKAEPFRTVLRQSRMAYQRFAGAQLDSAVTEVLTSPM